MYRNRLGRIDCLLLWLFTQTENHQHYTGSFHLSLFLLFFHFCFVGTFVIHMGEYRGSNILSIKLVYESCRSQTTFIIFRLVCAFLAFHVMSQIHLTHISCYTPTFFFFLIHLPLGRVDSRSKIPYNKVTCMHMRIVIYAVTELLYHIYIMLLVLSFHSRDEQEMKV